MWKAVIVLSVILLSGCNPSYEDKNASYSLPPEMQDCKVYKLHGDAIVIRYCCCQMSKLSNNNIL